MNNLDKINSGKFELATFINTKYNDHLEYLNEDEFLDENSTTYNNDVLVFDKNTNITTNDFLKLSFDEKQNNRFAISLINYDGVHFAKTELNYCNLLEILNNCQPYSEGYLNVFNMKNARRLIS